MDSISGSGKSPGGWHGNPLQYSCLKKSHGQSRLASCSPWGRKESDTNLSDLTHTCIKVLEDTTGKNLHYLVFGKEFLDMTPKA